MIGILYKSSANVSLELCPDFMGAVVGRASFPFHNSQKFQLILVGISVEKLTLR